MLTPVQLVKFGFLYKCAEAGLTRDEIHLLVKQALLGMGELGYKALTATPDALAKTLAIGLGVPVIAGGGIGHVAAKLTQDPGASIEETKQEELEDEYRRLAAEAQANARRRQLQSAIGKRVTRMSGPRLAM